ncbi:maleylacetoacetate isomerase [Sphingomonas sp.]|uniref:maleylacetoacetate isomerase n=1 Tax=Sphingomonas sp. TaxID=28214 RepID=UPI002DD6B620|nr:maleylacetoacetate isomerase [Sphingomonas sp.]
MILHDYWRSSAAYRVRIGLNLKDIAWKSAPRDLRTGEQRAADYLAIAPQGLVPALDTGAYVLTQSLAILEWLDETHPLPAFLPPDAAGRARVRAMAQAIAVDIHPINNLRVLKVLKADFGAEQPAIDAWVRHWIDEGFAALERMAPDTPFLSGDAPGLADICLVPQWYNAERFETDLAPYPRLAAVVSQARALPAFADASPDRHSDAG